MPSNALINVSHRDSPAQTPARPEGSPKKGNIFHLIWLNSPRLWHRLLWVVGRAAGEGGATIEEEKAAAASEVVIEVVVMGWVRDWDREREQELVAAVAVAAAAAAAGFRPQQHVALHAAVGESLDQADYAVPFVPSLRERDIGKKVTGLARLNNGD